MPTTIDDAYRLYEDGNFLKAYDAFKRAERELGAGLFDINLKLCVEKFCELRGRTIDPDNLRIACIMDEFTWSNFYPEAAFLQLRPANVVQQLEQFDPDFVFVESAWKGIDNQWDEKVSGFVSPELKELSSWCKKNNVPSIFWNKEDPVNFRPFIKSAALFDFVFTTDIDSISRYKSILGHERVFLMPFACQPRLQNPVEMEGGRKKGFCFAGSYYKRFPERMDNLESLLDAFATYAPLAIYDRNYGTDFIWFKFPEKYKQFILGKLAYQDIDLSYKGFEYAINLNSVKQSQSMFARRVFEAMASNTPVVSNYSRGIKNFFGDLVFMSDNGPEIVRRLKNTDALSMDKIRLAALRKVMSEHTYRHRLDYLLETVTGIKRRSQDPLVLCASRAVNADEALAIAQSWKSQIYANKKLVVFVGDDVVQEVRASLAVFDAAVFLESECLDTALDEIAGDYDWLAWLDTRDWYGTHYLEDFMLAKNWTVEQVLGKDEHWFYGPNGLEKTDCGTGYRLSANLPLRRSLVARNFWAEELKIRQLLDMAANSFKLAGTALDSLNYCENGRLYDCSSLTDMPVFDTGINIQELYKFANNMPPMENACITDPHQLAGWELYKQFPQTQNEGISLINTPYFIEIQSNASENIPANIHTNDIPVKKFQINGVLYSFLDYFGFPNLKYEIVFMDENKKILQSKLFQPKLYNFTKIPAKTEFFKVGLKAFDKGYAILNSIDFSCNLLKGKTYISINKYIIITDHYPDYDDLYRYGFLHTRILAYKEKGLNVDIFIVSYNSPLLFKEYQGIQVLVGDPVYLKNILKQHPYEKIIVHFLKPGIWKIIKDFPEIEKLIWIHGSEIQPWHRRIFNYATNEERNKAIEDSNLRMDFWRTVFADDKQKVKLVFVSNYLAKEVMTDYNIYLSKERYVIIHNPIDTKLFQYYLKDDNQRYNILTIRPFASRKYANDLSVDCILELSKRLDFNKFKIMIVGDGILFKETVAPLRVYDNVTIKQGFLNHEEIAELHKNFGIFLVPTRWDSQGVSKDEAMASGLVPVTNNITAMSEFTDDSCGILAPAEDAQAMADGICKLVDNPWLFQKMSRAASENVRATRGKDEIIDKELALICGDNNGEFQKADDAACPPANKSIELAYARLEEYDISWEKSLKDFNKLAEIYGIGSYENLIRFCRKKICKDWRATDTCKISIIIPLYNAEKYFSRCLESIFNQTLKDVEIIVYNDASTDGSLAIAQKYAATHKNIRIMEGLVNRGQGYGRNACLAVSAGEYITFIDADDYYADKDFLLYMYETAKSGNFDAVLGFYQIERNGKRISQCMKNETVTGVEAARRFFRRDYSTHGPCAKLYKRRIAENSSFIEYGYSEDVLFSLEALLKAERVKVVNRAGYIYFVDNVSSFRPKKFTLKHVYSSLRLLAEIINFTIKMARFGIKFDLLPFIGTWQKDHGKRLKNIFTFNDIDQKQINFINSKFSFLQPFINSILDNNISKNLIYDGCEISIDENYMSYKNYLNCIVCEFDKNFKFNLFHDRNELIIYSIPDILTDFIYEQYHNIFGNKYDISVQ